jgi:hypothetical protein
MPKLVGTSAREENREGGRIAKLALEEGRGKPGLEGIDPNFGRFGGQLSANDRFISAEVVGGSDPNWYQIKLHVRSTDSARPISGPVEFHLHPTFKPDVVTVMPVDGEARLQVWAWGSFVVGAVMDNKKTSLEIDLGNRQQVPSAPEAFRNR